MRNIYLLILFCCWIFPATAQTKFGVSAGYILSTLIDSDGKTFESEDVRGKLYSQSSVYAGAYMHNRLDDRFSMNYELNYVVAGGMLEAHLKDPSVSFISRMEFHQIQIPLSINYGLSRNFSVYSGLFGGVKILTRYKFVRFSLPAFQPDLVKKLQKELEKETNGRLEPFSLGVFAGAAYKFTDRFGLTTRYNYTFTNLSSKQPESLRMHFLQAGITYDLAKS